MVKKAVTPKKTTAKKLSKKVVTKNAAKGRVDTRRVIIGVSATLVAFAAALVLAYLALTIMQRAEITERKDRIETIYSDLAIDDQRYIMQRAEGFDEQAFSQWGMARDYEVVKEYVHGNTVSETAAELDSAAKAAGFTPTEASMGEAKWGVSYRYTSEKGEHLKVSVISKQRYEALQNASLMNQLSEQKTAEILDTISADAGPVIVTVKVNLGKEE